MGRSAHPIASEVTPLVDFLPNARANFVPVHVGQARQLVLPSRCHRFLYLTFGPQDGFHRPAVDGKNRSTQVIVRARLMRRSGVKYAAFCPTAVPPGGKTCPL